MLYSGCCHDELASRKTSTFGFALEEKIKESEESDPDDALRGVKKDP